MIFVGYSSIAINKSALHEGVLSYLTCEAGGTSKECQAIKKELESLSTKYVWMIVNLMLGIYLGINMIYSMNLTDLKKKWISWWLSKPKVIKE